MCIKVVIQVAIASSPTIAMPSHKEGRIKNITLII